MADRLLQFTIEPLATEQTAHGTIIKRATLLVESGVRFELTGNEPPFIAVRSAVDEGGCPVIQLLGRDDPDQPWRVLQQVERPM